VLRPAAVLPTNRVAYLDIEIGRAEREIGHGHRELGGTRPLCNRDHEQTARERGYDSA
jgi:hypothetical protein